MVISESFSKVETRVLSGKSGLIKHSKEVIIKDYNGNLWLDTTS